MRFRAFGRGVGSGVRGVFMPKRRFGRWANCRNFTLLGQKRGGVCLFCPYGEKAVLARASARASKVAFFRARQGIAPFCARAREAELERACARVIKHFFG